MVMYLKESKAIKFVSKYKKNAVFTTDRTLKATRLSDDTTISYVYLEQLYPTLDEIQGYIRGDLSAKKIIKNMRKRVTTLDCDGSVTNFQVALSTILSIISSKEPIAVIFLRQSGEDEESKKVDKLFKKYFTEMFDLFGIDVVTSIPKKILKGKKSKVCKRIAQVITSSSKISKAGRYLMHTISATHYADVNKNALDAIKDPTNPKDLSKRELQSAATRLLSTLDGTHIKKYESLIETWPSKKERKKVLKSLAKNHKKYVKYYNEYRDMINALNYDGIKKMPKMPKVKAGKGLKAKDAKKFMKFFTKRSNFGFMLGAYTHIILSIYEVEFGSGEYNKAMADAHRFIAVDGFAKAYATSCTEMRKALAKQAKQQVAAAK